MRIFLDNNGVSTLWSQFKAKLAMHTDAREIHVTAAEKAGWNAKADLSDIPTTLPANGGRSDTTRHQMFHTLGTGTDILSFATSDNCPSGLNTKVRIMHSPTCPTNYGYNAADNDFWYDIFKLDNSWITIKAYDVRGNVEFINSRINGKWSGWVRSADGGNANTANLAGAFSSTPTNVCLRNLSSGTADVTTTNCPRGAWYGKHS